MKTLFTSFTLLYCTLAIAQYMPLDFEEYNLPLDTAITASATNPDSSFIFNGLEFPSIYSAAYGGFWVGGWALSTSRNDSIKDFTNLFGSASGGGALGSKTYMVGQNGAYILPDENVFVYSPDYTNLAYTAEVLLNGSGFSTAFGTDSTGTDVGFPDSLILFMNYYLDGELVNFTRLPLANYALAPQADYIITEWGQSLVNAGDLPLIRADSIVFNLVSSQSGQFGNNTPDFFAIDDLLVANSGANNATEAKVVKVDIYPNPTHSTARFSNIDAIGDLFVFDNNGRIILHTEQHSASSEINLTALPSGLYYLFLKSDTQTIRGTIIKE